MNSLEYIDDFYQGQHTEEASRLFEQKILQEPGFAEDLAFYLSTRQLSRSAQQDERLQRFRELYHQQATIATKPGASVIRWIRRSVAVAAILAGLAFGIWIYSRPASSDQLAKAYIEKNMDQLPLHMGKADQLQDAAALYNSAKYNQALSAFEALMKQEPVSYEVYDYAGRTALQMKEYDKALDYFRHLQSYTNLYSNPAVFYQALTLMMRNHPGDHDEARKLLQQVVDQHLDESGTAREWLKNW